MSNKSMQEHAFTALKKKRKPVEFKVLWDEVANEMGLEQASAQSRMIKFYNSLSLDARFYQLSGNKWDLASRHSVETIRNAKKKFDDIDDDEIDDYEEDIDDSLDIPTDDDE